MLSPRCSTAKGQAQCGGALNRVSRSASYGHVTKLFGILRPFLLYLAIKRLGGVAMLETALRVCKFISFPASPPCSFRQACPVEECPTLSCTRSTKLPLELLWIQA